MGKLIYEGHLDIAEYRKLWFSKRKESFWLSGVISLAFIFSFVATGLAFSIIYADDSSLLNYVRIFSTISTVLLSGCDFYMYFKTEMTGGRPPYNDVKVYQDKDVLSIEWMGARGLRCSKAVKMNIVLKTEGHLYVEENWKNFVFLPEEAADHLLDYKKDESNNER